MTPPDAVTRLNAALAGRYQVERELGQGGMATVFLARDLKHNRSVALKVLKPELAAVVGAERFLAEIETTARLTHPSILPLHDSGEADGLLYYVMPFVEGESLRDKLDREPQLPVDEAVRIATEVAEALNYAHRQGVIHRDIKPANILLIEGRAVVADFGIALAADTVGGARLTETGLSLGTPHYMSPEQAVGDAKVDARSDTYALGCVVYEMLVGEPPHTGRTAQAILGRIMKGEVAPLTDVRSTVPAHVEAAVLQALQKTPADRFGTTGAFAEALTDPDFGPGTVTGAASAAPTVTLSRRTMISAAAAVVVLAGLGWVAFSAERASPAGDPDPSLAVLLFEDRSPNGDDEYFAANLGEEIQVALGQLQGLKLIATGSSFALDREGLTPDAIGERLNVAHVLDGSVQRTGDDLRVRAFLIDAATGFELWSGSFEQTIDDVFAIQDTIARAVAVSLQISHTGTEERPLVEVVAPSREAYEAVLLAGSLISETGRNVLQRIELYEEAIRIDSTYAEAWRGLGISSLLYAETGAPPDYAAVRARGMAAAERAVELRPNWGAARLSLATQLNARGEWGRAREELDIALTLSPSDPRTLSVRGWVLWQTGDVEGGIEALRAAAELDPESYLAFSNLAWALNAAGRHDEAVGASLRARQLDPDDALNQSVLWGTLMAADRFDEAEREMWVWNRMVDADSVAEQQMFDAIRRYRTTGEQTELDYPLVDPRNGGMVLYHYGMSGQFDRAMQIFGFLEATGGIGAITRMHSSILHEVMGGYPPYEAMLDRLGITWQRVE